MYEAFLSDLNIISCCSVWSNTGRRCLRWRSFWISSLRLPLLRSKNQRYPFSTVCQVCQRLCIGFPDPVRISMSNSADRCGLVEDVDQSLALNDSDLLKMNAFKGERDVEGAGFIKPVRRSNPSPVLVVTGVPQPNTALWIRHAYWLCLLASQSCMQDELGTFWVTGLQTCDPYLIMHWCEWWSLNVNWVCFETVCTSKQHDCPVFFFVVCFFCRPLITMPSVFTSLTGAVICKLNLARRASPFAVS